MLLGAAVGVLSVAVAAVDMRVNLPDWMVQVAMIKLAFIASGGLLAAGALLARHAKTRSLGSATPDLLPHERAEPLQTPGSRTPNNVERRAERN